MIVNLYDLNKTLYHLITTPLSTDSLLKTKPVH